MSTTPVNVQIPSDAEAPVIADFMEHALRVAYIDRSSLTALPADEWNQPGVYVLLTGDGSGHVYIGQARQLRARLLQHNNKQKLGWHKAVAIKRDTTNGFNTAEIGYLEGRVSAELAAVEGVIVIEGQKSGDETLPEHMMISLDSFVKSILAALRLAGINITRRQEQQDSGPLEDEASQKRVSRVTYTVKVADLVASGLLRAGATLHLQQGEVQATGTVTADGEIIVGGVAYASPSTAAAKALQLQSSNGWITWHVGAQDGVTLDHLRKTWLSQHQRGGQQ